MRAVCTDRLLAGSMTTTFDLTEPDEVLAWAKQYAQQAAPSADDIKKAQTLADGMRLKKAWGQHRNHIHGLASVSPYSNQTNRQTFNRAIRALCYAMDRALGKEDVT